MHVFITILCSLLAVCSVSARDSRHEGTDRQPSIYRLPSFERAVRCTKYFEGWHSEKHHPYVGYGHRLQPGERYSHAPWRSGRRTRFCGKTCGSSAQCSNNSGKIVCSLPHLPTMYFWGVGRYPKARWSESWRQAIGTFTGSSTTVALPLFPNSEAEDVLY